MESRRTDVKWRNNMFKDYVMSTLGNCKFDADTGSAGSAETNEVVETATEKETSAENTQSEKTEKMFSRDELAKIVAAETKKAVEQAEARRKLSDEEKAKFDLDQEREAFEQEKVALQKERNETTVLKFLAAEKLPESLSGVFTPLLADSDTLEKALTEVSKSFRTALDDAVNERLKRNIDDINVSSGSAKESVGEQLAKELNQQAKAETSYWK